LRKKKKESGFRSGFLTLKENTARLRMNHKEGRGKGKKKVSARCPKREGWGVLEGEERRLWRVKELTPADFMKICEQGVGDHGWYSASESLVKKLETQVHNK